MFPGHYWAKSYALNNIFNFKYRLYPLAIILSVNTADTALYTDQQQNCKFHLIIQLFINRQYLITFSKGYAIVNLNYDKFCRICISI